MDSVEPPLPSCSAFSTTFFVFYRKERNHSHDLGSFSFFTTRLDSTGKRGRRMAAYSSLNSPNLNRSRHASSPRVWLAIGGLVVLGFLLWPSTSSSLPDLSELSPSFSNHFQSSSTSSLSRVELSTDPVPIEEDVVVPGVKWWEDISIVYTWVNGSETSFLEDKAKVTGEDVGSNRFRDDGLFKYSVRSIERYLPWHKGEIILLSRRNHVPDWMDLSQPR